MSLHFSFDSHKQVSLERSFFYLNMDALVLKTRSEIRKLPGYGRWKLGKSTFERNGTPMSLGKVHNIRVGHFARLPLEVTPPVGMGLGRRGKT